MSGEYVEARTAEVFTGGCIMGSEAETMGKQAVLAWKVDRGIFNGVSLDGLSVVAAVAGDRNLGIAEIGGGQANVRSAVFVDAARQPRRSRSRSSRWPASYRRASSSNIVEVTPAPIQFSDQGQEIQVATTQVVARDQQSNDARPDLRRHAVVPPVRAVGAREMGVTEQHTFTGSALGTKWSDPNKRSAFFGTFEY